MNKHEPSSPLNPAPDSGPPPGRGMLRRVSAALLLILLLTVPFFNWRLGMLLWLCAWTTFILGKLFNRRNWKLGQPEDDDKDGV